MYIYIYIYIYIHTHTCIDMCVYIYIYIYIHTDGDQLFASASRFTDAQTAHTARFCTEKVWIRGFDVMIASFELSSVNPPTRSARPRLRIREPKLRKRLGVLCRFYSIRTISRSVQWLGDVPRLVTKSLSAIVC